MEAAFESAYIYPGMIAIHFRCKMSPTSTRESYFSRYFTYCYQMEVIKVFHFMSLPVAFERIQRTNASVKNTRAIKIIMKSFLRHKFFIY
jgi:hypothetical protein